MSSAIPYLFYLYCIFALGCFYVALYDIGYWKEWRRDCVDHGEPFPNFEFLIDVAVRLLLLTAGCISLCAAAYLIGVI